MTVLRIATLFPRCTVAAGDEANASALARRSQVRGIEVQLWTVDRPETMVDAEVYLLGGSGRTGTGDLVDRLAEVGLADRVAAGSVVVAVDAGMHAVARSWAAPDGTTRPGIGLLDLDVLPGPQVTAGAVTEPGLHGLPAMVGWISHDVRLMRGPGASPLSVLVAGRSGPVADGAVGERVVATSLHGPALALNPELADLVLARALGPLAPAAIPSWAAQARASRIGELTSRRGRGRR